MTERYFSPRPGSGAVSSIELKKKETFNTWISDVIRYNDLDPNGHVNNVAVCTFFEDGRVMFRDRHFKHQVENVLTGFVLARYIIEYHRPLEFPGSVDVGTTITRIGRSSYTFGQAVFHGEECAATAEAVQVRVDPKTGRSMPLSDEFKAMLRAVALPAAEA
jgi:acyl-CoA thioester hydrolase